MEEATPSPATELRRTERYTLHEQIASGGMATVHIGMLKGALGFSRVVAIKRLHFVLSSNPHFVSMLIDEARLVSRIRHVNVVPTLDIIERGPEVFVIMEYVRGASLAKLIELTEAKGELVPLSIVVPIMVGVLRGLGAAHEATDLDGRALEIVHRDVSPQNILVGVGGVPRVIDFGVADAVGRMTHTQTGEFKGKLSYAPPEQVFDGEATRRSDVFAAGIILWELVTGGRLFARDTHVATLRELLDGEIVSPLVMLDTDARMKACRDRDEVAALTPIVMRALAREPEGRFESAEEMARCLEGALRGASPPAVGAWVQSVARAQVEREGAMVARAEAVMSASVDSERTRLASGTEESSQATTLDERVAVDRGSGDGDSSARSSAVPAPGRPVLPAGLLLAVVLAAALGAAVGSAFVARAGSGMLAPSAHHVDAR